MSKKGGKLEIEKKGVVFMLGEFWFQCSDKYIMKIHRRIQRENERYRYRKKRGMR